MALRGRVGRHAKTGGRHCQNWVEDQQAVIALLNRIPVSEGGAGGSLGGRLVAGLASDQLFQAILRFEEKHFPGQRSGFVDPGGPMLRRMEALASGNSTAAPRLPTPPPVVEETLLDELRRNLLDPTPSYGVFTAGQAVEFEPLVELAVKHVDGLKAQGFVKLPWPVEMFGRAHVTNKPLGVYHNVNTWTIIWGDDFQLFFEPGRGNPGSREKAPPLPQMRYGEPVDPLSHVVTEKLGALLLFQGGGCLRIPPYHFTASNLATTEPYLKHKSHKHSVVEMNDHP